MPTLSKRRRARAVNAPQVDARINVVALVILLLEWYLYHRRMQILTTFRPLQRTTARR